MILKIGAVILTKAATLFHYVNVMIVDIIQGTKPTLHWYSEQKLVLLSGHC